MATTFDSNIKLDFKSIDIDEHAVKRAKERFKRKDKQDALNYFKTLLGASTYVGESTCEHGNKAHMFVATNKTVIYVSLDCSKIITAFAVNEKPYIVYPEKTEVPTIKDQEAKKVIEENPLQDKLIKLYTIEFKKYNKIEKRLENSFITLKLQCEIEISKYKLLMFRAKSQKKKDEYKLKITELMEKIKENEDQLKKVQGDKRKISKVLATLLSE